MAMDDLHVEGHRAVDVVAAEISGAAPLKAYEDAVAAAAAAMEARQAAIAEADHAAMRADELTQAVAAGGADVDREMLVRRAAEERITVDAMQRRASDLRASTIPEADSRAAAAKVEADRYIDGRLRRVVDDWAGRLAPEYRRIVGAAEIIDAGVRAIARRHGVTLPADFPWVLSNDQKKGPIK